MTAERELEKHIRETCAWSADPTNRRLMQEEECERIESWIAAADRDPLSLSQPLAALASWNAGTGACAILSGEDGWDALEAGFAYRMLRSRITVQRFDDDERRRPATADLAGSASMLWAWAVWWKADRSAGLLGERLASAPESGVFQGFDRPVTRFVHGLVMMSRGKDPLYDLPAPYDAILSSLYAGERPRSADLEAACDQHLKDITSGSPLIHLPYNVLPVELLACSRVAHGVGVDLALPEHPLLGTALCSPRSVTTATAPYWAELTEALGVAPDL